jgi:hypothetical protein
MSTYAHIFGQLVCSDCNRTMKQWMEEGGKFRAVCYGSDCPNKDIPFEVIPLRVSLERVTS